MTSKRQDRRAFLQGRALLGQQRHDGARQRRDDLVLADLLLVVATERIDPMQIETTVAGSQIKFVAFDDGDNMRYARRRASNRIRRRR